MENRTEKHARSYMLGESQSALSDVTGGDLHVPPSCLPAVSAHRFTLNSPHTEGGLIPAV